MQSHSVRPRSFPLSHSLEKVLVFGSASSDLKVFSYICLYIWISMCAHALMSGYPDVLMSSCPHVFMSSCPHIQVSCDWRHSPGDAPTTHSAFVVTALYFTSWYCTKVPSTVHHCREVYFHAVHMSHM